MLKAIKVGQMQLGLSQTEIVSERVSNNVS
jgi:hypothetical protein